MKVFKTKNMGADAVIILDKICYARKNYSEGCFEIAFGFENTTTNYKTEIHFLYCNQQERDSEFDKLMKIISKEERKVKGDE